MIKLGKSQVTEEFLSGMTKEEFVKWYKPIGLSTVEALKIAKKHLKTSSKMSKRSKSE